MGAAVGGGGADSAGTAGAGRGVRDRCARRGKPRGGLETAGFVAGVDANAGMLAVAARTSNRPIPDDERRIWRAAEAIPYEDDRFDAVVCQFGLMFFNQQAALREMMRVLVPGGHLTAAVWDTLEHTPAYAIGRRIARAACGPTGSGCAARAVRAGRSQRAGGAVRAGGYAGRRNPHASRPRALSKHPIDGGSGRARLAAGGGCDAERITNRRRSSPRPNTCSARTSLPMMARSRSTLRRISSPLARRVA